LEVNEQKARQRLAEKLTVIDRPKPKIYSVAQSSILSRVRTFMPAMQKAQVELYKKMKAEGDESVNLENTEEDERVVELNCGIVPSELIADSDCESDSSTDDDMDLEELRLIQLINSKMGHRNEASSEASSGSTGNGNKIELLKDNQVMEE